MIALIDGQVASALPLDDRALAYGDGVFETILLHEGRPVWWEEHLQRLRTGAERLGLCAPANDAWEADLAALQSTHPLPERGVLKLILSAGSSSRGYARGETGAPRRLLQLGPAPMPRAATGIEVRWCRTQLAIAPQLAGIKHLNRLEQVLARAEWSDAAIFEGLMCDSDGRLVCATAANVFARIDGRWSTPRLNRCGVAGICRQQLMPWSNALERDLMPAEVMSADELFVCSSVRGILPVTTLDDLHWPVGPQTLALIRRLALQQPAFDPFH